MSNHPAVDISWYEARAFCAWLTANREYNPHGHTYRLPDEEEWEYAARGAEMNNYPWGFEMPDDEHANIDNQHQGTTTVGCFPQGATPDGILDLAGNVWEWTSSVYAHYPIDSVDNHESLDQPRQKQFVVRGGGWYSTSSDILTTHRFHLSASYQDGDLGFRMVGDLP
jgi:formylglycine-generating enzyme required for sulfatase activity